ncbi:MAG TPA: dipeptidase PepE [Terriglobales bacterium]|nr:dipeptidase PepE [Terriglobales bacterium]
MSTRLLLLSSSRVHGGGYLDHAESQISDFLKRVTRVLFVPYALKDREGYVAVARQRFEAMGFGLDSIHNAENQKKAVENAEAIFVGGGNTFRLLNTLYQLNLLASIRVRVNSGMPYVGASAGSNIAGPTIKTTNDMPIVQPSSFEALGLVPFQINPHYIDADQKSTHMGETREQRLREFLEENDGPVVAIREAAMIHVEDGVITLEGTAGARVFRRGREPYEIEPGNLIEF